MRAHLQYFAGGSQKVMLAIGHFRRREPCIWRLAKYNALNITKNGHQNSFDMHKNSIYLIGEKAVHIK